MRKLLSLLLVMAVPCLAAERWANQIGEAVDRTRVGMTYSEIKKIVPAQPWVMRIYLKGGTEVVEWMYPTGEQKWSSLVFENGQLASRKDRTASAYPRQFVKAFTAEETDKRQKLRTVTLGMPVKTFDALGVSSSSTITSADWREAKASPEVANFKDATQVVGKALGFVGSGPSLFDVDPATFDEIRYFEMASETIYVIVKADRVEEIASVAKPSEEWMTKKVVEILASKKTSAADFEKINPGMRAEQLIFVVGVPSSEEKTKTADGIKTVWTYRLSRREVFEVELQNDVVVAVKSRSKY